MKRIYFDHKIDWLMLIFIVLAAGFYVIAHSDWFDLEEGQRKFLFLLGGILNVIVLTKMLWYKYYVRWNSNAITIKFKTFSSHTLPFEKIEAFEFTESQLIIQRTRKKEIRIPTEGIVEEDLQKLEGILINHTQTAKA